MRDQSARIQHEQASGIRNGAVQLPSGAHAGPDAIRELIPVVLLHVAQSVAQCRCQLGAVADQRTLLPHDGRQLAQHQGGVQRHVRLVTTVLGDQLVVKGDREQPADAQIHVVVGAGIHRRVEPADVVEHAPPEHHHSGHANAVAAQQFEVHVPARRSPLRVGHQRSAVAGDVAAGAGNESERRIGGQPDAIDIDRFGHQSIVRVEKDHELSVTSRESGIPRRGEPRVLLLDVADRVPGGHGGRLIRRAVVDDDHLDGGIRLPQHAFNRVREEVGLPETGDHDRHQARRAVPGSRLWRDGSHLSRALSGAAATRHS